MAVTRSRIPAGYICVIAASFAVALLIGWTALADHIDGSAYDWTYQIQAPKPWPTQSVVLAIDEDTLREIGGISGYRHALAQTLNLIRPAHPKTIAIDVLLADRRTNPRDRADDDALEAALAKSTNVVLPADISPMDGKWEEPLPRFAAHAAAIGHVHARRNPISRMLPLREIADHKRHWAVALESFRLFRGAPVITESPDELEVAGEVIPIQRGPDALMYIRYLPPSNPIPRISIAALMRDPALAIQVKDKAVFIGVTALSAADDRLPTPYDTEMSGIEIHAQAFETMQHGQFLSQAGNSAVVGWAVLLAIGAGVTFYFLSGWLPYVIGAALIVCAHMLPHIALANGLVFPLLFPVLSAWLSVASAATWMHFVVRRQLRKSETDRARYQQAIHFVTHEMRSPLTAIQGSSELMGRYNLNDDKRKQIASMINSESKRLARMIQTFLDVERLSQGQMELRSDRFDAKVLIDACVQRATPLAERKKIDLKLEEVEPFPLTGDRELMEYAVYNLLTNAIKYSPAETTVTVGTHASGDSMRLSVADEGIGMDEKELRNIFKKFYRTKKAETSGEAGTGIGLSIVDQIVASHGGRIEVASTPGKGSCFTMVLPKGIASASVPASTSASG